VGYVLVVDDEKAIRITLHGFLEHDGHMVWTAETAEQALALVQNQVFDVIVTDIIMPKVSGIELLSTVREKHLDAEVILITGVPDIDSAIQAVQQGAFDYLVKPVTGDVVCKTVSRALKTKMLKDENKRLWEANLRHAENLEHLVQKRTAQLKESEEKFRTIFENANDVIVYFDPEGTILEINSKVEELFGYKPEEVVGKPFAEIGVLTEPSLKKVQQLFQHAVLGGPTSIREIEAQHRNGQSIWIETNTRLIEKDAQAQAILIVIRDITARKKAEMLLFEYQRNLQSLSSELLLTEERQRRIISSELHDRVGQTLAGTKIKVGLLRNRLSDAEHVEQAEEVTQLLDQCVRDVWSLTFELCPPMLYEVGLIAALDWLVKQFIEEHGIECVLEDQGEYDMLNDEVRGLLFQSTRELLKNIAKHASADRAYISVKAEDNQIRLSIEDNGVGFNPTPTRSNGGEQQRFGLFGIRERVKYFNGTLAIDSSSGKGTRVTITLPISMEPSDLSTSLRGG